MAFWHLAAKTICNKTILENRRTIHLWRIWLEFLPFVRRKKLSKLVGMSKVFFQKTHVSTKCQIFLQKLVSKFRRISIFIVHVYFFFGENGDYKACVEILNSLEDYGVENRAQICNQVMGTCVQYGQFHVVESIYNSMEHANISPNYKTFIHLARAYAHHRVDAETIDKVLAQMHEKGIKQSAEIYNGFLACIDSVEQVS